MNRRSIREFKKDPVDDKLIGVMLSMATQAPSAGNVQDWEFIVVKDEDVKKKLADAALKQRFIAKAPVVIVVCSDLKRISLKYAERGERMYALQDTSFAIMNMLLSAHALGLGACVVASFDEEEVRRILIMPETSRPVAIIPVGYPNEEPLKPDKIPFGNLTSVNEYGKKYDIAYTTQIGPGQEVKIKPIGNMLEDVIEKHKKKGKKLTFEELLKRLSK